jgi:hypothetical protein
MTLLITTQVISSRYQHRIKYMNVVSVDTSLLTYTVVTECLDRGDGRRWVDDDDGAITGKSEREIKQGDWVW